MNTIAEIKLTPDQASAIAKMKDFCAYPRNKYFRLTGYAGTGKTFTICQLIQWLNENNYKVIAASPTNKAAKNLEVMANEAGIALQVTTVAKLLGQQAILNEKTGKEEFISKGEQKIDDYDIIIVDEFSMVNTDNFLEIQSQVDCAISTKVIFVGDSAQLPPVKEQFPIIADHPNIRDYANLSTVVRYDGELAKVAEEIRSDEKYNKCLYPFTSSEDESIILLERYEWLCEAVAAFKSDEFKANPNYVRFLVWRNKTAEMLNNYVRKFLFGKDVPSYAKGDRLIAKVPVFRTEFNDFKNKDEWRILLNSSEECEVIGNAIKCHDLSYGWEFWQVPVITDDGLTIDLRILTEQGKKDQEEYLKSLKEKASQFKQQKQWSKRKKVWGQYYDAMKSFDTLPHAYAITTHKAQGSSINYAFVDVPDMRGCPDLQKILYTALTRAKTQAFIPE